MKKILFITNKKNIDILILIVLIAVITISFSIFLAYKLFFASSNQIEAVSALSTLDESSEYSLDSTIYSNNSITESENNIDSISEITSTENVSEEVTDIYSASDSGNSESLSYQLTTGDATYYIRVNYLANVVNIYTKDEDGYYSVPVMAMLCSCGTATPTSGTYTLSNKYRWLSLVGNVYGQYATQIVDNILFHSVPYLSKSNDSLEYWEYDKLGTTASAGCVRLNVSNAKWIYDNCESGTIVEFYSDTNPRSSWKT